MAMVDSQLVTTVGRLKSTWGLEIVTMHGYVSCQTQYRFQAAATTWLSVPAVKKLQVHTYNHVLLV